MRRTISVAPKLRLYVHSRLGTKPQSAKPFSTQTTHHLLSLNLIVHNLRVYHFELNQPHTNAAERQRDTDLVVDLMFLAPTPYLWPSWPR